MINMTAGMTIAIPVMTIIAIIEMTTAKVAGTTTVMTDVGTAGIPEIERAAMIAVETIVVIAALLPREEDLTSATQSQEVVRLGNQMIVWILEKPTIVASREDLTRATIGNQTAEAILAEIETTAAPRRRVLPNVTAVVAQRLGIGIVTAIRVGMIRQHALLPLRMAVAVVAPA